MEKAVIDVGSRKNIPLLFVAFSRLRRMSDCLAVPYAESRYKFDNRKSSAGKRSLLLRLKIENELKLKSQELVQKNLEEDESSTDEDIDLLLGD